MLFFTKYRLKLFLFASMLSFSLTVCAEPELRVLHYLLELDKTASEEFHPPETIYRKNGILFCTGDSYLAIENNNGAVLMQSGEFEEAISVFEAALLKAPLFFPYIYNLGKSYAHLLKYRRAFVYLNKAKAILPNYFLTYIEIGRAYETSNKLSLAIDNYRIAAKLYPDNLESYIYLGNVYLKQKRRQQAKKYYEAVLEKDPYYANGLLGKARLQFVDKNYYKAFMTLKIIDISSGSYDKAYHYYYAECAYKLKRYQVAYEQYKKLLEFKSDRFFITTQIKLIEHKMELSRRFAEQEALIKELQGN